MQGQIQGTAKVQELRGIALKPQQTPSGAFGICLESCGTSGMLPLGAQDPVLDTRCGPAPFPWVLGAWEPPWGRVWSPALGFNRSQVSLCYTRSHSQLGEGGFGWEISFGCLWDPQPWSIQPQRVPWVLPQSPD